MLYTSLEDKATIKPIIMKASVTIKRNVSRSNPVFYIISGLVMVVGFILMITGMGKKR